MVPAQIMTAAVSVRPDASTQSLHLGNQLFPRQSFKVFVHDASFLMDTSAERCQQRKQKIEAAFGHNFLFPVDWLC
jgi:hypothetical protein